MASVFEHLRRLQALAKEKDDPKKDALELLAGGLNSCYFLHGGEPYLGRVFVDRLKALLFESGSADFNVDRFWMDEAGWADVIDAARTAPTFFSPWRLVTAEFLVRTEDRSKDREEDKLSEAEAGILDAYLGALPPLPGTILVVLYPSRIKHYKHAPVVEMFSRHFKETKNKDGPVKRSVAEVEISSLKLPALLAWLGGELESRKLALTPEARARLVEVAGNDLRKLTSEMDKLQAYAAEKIQARSAVDVEEIDRVCAWTREIEPWGLTDALAVADWPDCARILNRLFREGEPELKILNDIAVFLRKIRQAKAWLEEGAMDRKAIFAKFQPQIKEDFRTMYARKFREFFLPVERLSRARMRRLFLELSRIDAAIKDGAGAQREMIEAFVYEYCRGMKNETVRRTRRG